MVLLQYYFPELWITVAIKPHCQPNLKPHFGQGWAGWGVSQSSSRHTNALIASSTSRWVFLCSVFSHLSYSQYRNHGSFWLCHLSYSPGGSCLGVYVEQDFFAASLKPFVSDFQWTVWVVPLWFAALVCCHMSRCGSRNPQDGMVRVVWWQPKRRHKPEFKEWDAAGWDPNVFPNCTENCGLTMPVSGRRKWGKSRN